MSNRLALVTLHYCVPACNCVATTAVGLCPVLQRGEKKVALGSEEIVTYLKEQVRKKTANYYPSLAYQKDITPIAKFEREHKCWPSPRISPPAVLLPGIQH